MQTFFDGKNDHKNKNNITAAAAATREQHHAENAHSGAEPHIPPAGGLQKLASADVATENAKNDRRGPTGLYLIKKNNPNETTKT